MRSLFLLALPILLSPLAGCGDAGDGGNDAAPAPRSTAPAPRTPVMEVTPAPGNQAEWMEASSNAADPVHAPYGNLLDDPVVSAPSKR